MKPTVTLMLLLTLAGCSAPIMVLQDPQTKQTVQCQSRPGANWNPAKVVEECAQSYEKAGYVRLSGK